MLLLILHGGDVQAFNFQGTAAAITGAASGIGRALALGLAARGCDLALADVDAAGLESAAKEITAAHARRVTIRRVDVADAKQVEEFAQAAITEFPSLGIVINNAGVALLGQFDEYDNAQLAWLMGINFWGVVHGTRAFLPHLGSRPQAHIVNISSIFGIIAPAGQSAYSASKFAVRGFSEALRHELAMNASPVRLSVVHPGGIKTAIARNAIAAEGVNARAQSTFFDKRLASTTPQRAAEIILERRSGRTIGHTLDAVTLPALDAGEYIAPGLDALGSDFGLGRNCD